MRLVNSSFLMTGLHGICGTEGGCQTGPQPSSTWGWAGPSASSRLGCPLEARSQSRVASRWSPPGRRPKSRSSTSNYLHFFQNKSIWNKFNAKMYTSSMLCPYYTPAHVIRAAWDKMCCLLFSHGSVLPSIYFCSTSPWVSGRGLAKHSGHRREGRCAAPRLALSVFILLLPTHSCQTQVISGLWEKCRKVGLFMWKQFKRELGRNTGDLQQNWAAGNAGGVAGPPFLQLPARPQRPALCPFRT